MILTSYATIKNGDYTANVIRPSKKERRYLNKKEFFDKRKEIVLWLQNRYNKMFRMECIFTEIN